jgi:hypothetical protein
MNQCMFCLRNQLNHVGGRLSLFFVPRCTFQSLYVVNEFWDSVVPYLSYWGTFDAFLVIWITQIVAMKTSACTIWPVRIMIDPNMI